MSKSDHEFVNFSDRHEMLYALKTNNFRQTEDNVIKLINSANTIKSHYNKSSSQNLTWGELHDYLRVYGVYVLTLEK